MIYVTIPKQIQTRLQGSATTVYTVPTATAGMPANKAILSEILLCNDDSGAVTYTLNIVPSGGTAGASNQIKKTVSIAAAGDSRLQFRTMIEQGGFISMHASAADKITATITVAELFQPGS